MKILVVLTAAAAIAAIGPARAQVDIGKLDLSKVLCKEMSSMKPPQVEQIVTWLQGYYTLEKAPRVIDPDKVKADVIKLDTYCKQNPQANLVAAADDVMGEP